MRKSMIACTFAGICMASVDVFAGPTPMGIEEFSHRSVMGEVVGQSNMSISLSSPSASGSLGQLAADFSVAYLQVGDPSDGLAPSTLSPTLVPLPPALVAAGVTLAFAIAATGKRSRQSRLKV